MLGDGDDDLGVVGGDDELAVLGSHRVVGGVRTLVKLIGEGVVALAHCGLGASGSDGHTLAVDKADALALRGDGDGIVGERGAVVLLVSTFGGKRDEALGDGDVLGAGGVLALGVVGAGCTEHNSLMTEVRQRDLGRVAHPRLAVEAVLNPEGVTVHVSRARGIGRKRASVVDLLDVLDDPIDLVGVNLAARNGEATVGDDKLDIREVVADVGELALVEAHVIRADSDTLGHGRTSKLNIGLGVSGVVRSDGVAGHDLLGAVESRSCAVADDGDGDLVGDRRHLESAVLRGDPVVASLGIGVELVGEYVLNFANVGDRGRVRKRCTLAVGKAGDGRHFLLGMLGSVVGPLARSRSQGDLSLVDDKLAVLGLHHELVGHNVAVAIGHNGGAGDVVGVLAGVNLTRALGRKARDGIRRTVDDEGISLDTRGLMSLAIVGGGGRVRLDRNLVLDVAVQDREGALGLVDDVVVGLRTLVQSIREGVCRAALNGLGAGEDIRGALTLGPAGLSLKRSLTIDEGAAVVLLGKVGRLEGNVRLGDVYKAVNHLEDDVREVNGIAVGELVGLEAHIGAARISALRLGGAGEHGLVLGVELVVRREGVSGSSEFLAVVSARCVVAVDCNNDRGLYGVNREGALVLRDDVVVGVGALIQRVAERVGGRASVGLGTGYAVGRILARNKPVAGDDDLVLDQGRTVVGLVGAGRRQRDSALLNGDRAVLNNLEGHVGEVLVGVLELLGSETHGRGARIGALGARRTLEGKVNILLSTIQVGGDTIDSDALNAVARHNVLAAVVLVGNLVARNLHNNGLLVRRHPEGALALGDVVVVGVSALVQRVGKRVERAADVGLEAGNVVGRALALDKALARNGNLVVGQNCTIEHLGVGSRGQGDRTRRNRKFAGLGGNGKLFGHVVARRVSHLGGAYDEVDILAGVRALDLSSQTRNSVHDAVDREPVGHNAGSSMLLAVVGSGSRDSLDLNCILCVTVGDGERARVLPQVVILLEIRACLGRDGLDGALARADLGLLAAVRAALDTLAIDKGTGDYLEIGCDKRLAVILLGCLCRLDGHATLGNRELAINRRHLELGRNVVARRIPDDGSTGDAVRILASVSAPGIRGRKALDGEGAAIGDDGRGLEPLGRLHSTVIGSSNGVRLDRNLVLLRTILDREGSGCLCDGVVSGIRVAVQLIGEGIGGATHSRLGAGKGKRGTLAISPTITRNFDRRGAVDERSAVVLLGKIRRLESDRALGNSKRAIGHIKTNAGAGEVLRDAVRQRKARAGKSHGVGTNVGACRLGSHVAAQDNLILSDQIGADRLNRKALNRLLGTGIGFGARGALNLNDDLISIGFDEKPAILGISNNVLARGVNRANRTLSKYCTIGTSIRTSCTNGDSREIGTLGRAGKARHALLRAVVRLGCRIRGQSHLLVVVHVDDVGTIAIDRDGSILVGYEGVAFNDLFAVSRSDNAAPSSRLRVRIGNLDLSAIEVVVHRVVDEVFFVVEDNGVVTLANRMSLFSGANQMIAVNCPGRIGAVRTKLAVARVGIGKLRASTVLQILHLVRNERLPRGSKGHIVGRHGEGGTTCKSSDIIQARNGPTSELIILTRGLMPHGLGRTLRSGIHGSV